MVIERGQTSIDFPVKKTTLGPISWYPGFLERGCTRQVRSRRQRISVEYINDQAPHPDSTIVVIARGQTTIGFRVKKLR